MWLKSSRKGLAEQTLPTTADFFYDLTTTMTSLSLEGGEDGSEFVSAETMRKKDTISEDLWTLLERERRSMSHLGLRTRRQVWWFRWWRWQRRLAETRARLSPEGR